MNEERDKKVDNMYTCYQSNPLVYFLKNLHDAQKVYTQEDLVNAIRYGTKIHINYIVDQDKSIVNKYGDKAYADWLFFSFPAQLDLLFESLLLLNSYFW